MTATHVSGPINVYGAPAVPATPSTGLGIAQDYNPDRGPSIFDEGAGIQDPRFLYAYAPGGETVYGWYGTDEVVLLDQVPSTASTTSIAAAQVPTAGTALTLVSTSGSGITVSTTITDASTGAQVTGLLAIDTAMTPLTYGSSGNFKLWDPTKALARCVTIDSSGDDSGGTFTVAGYDVYGYPMTETITGANSTTATGSKAFKYIESITPAGTLAGSNVSVGQSDTIGFLLRNDRFQYLKIYWPDTTLISASTGWTAADTTSPATATTGDVRGTYALQSSSDNSKRLIIFAKMQVANISSSTGLVGVTQA